MPRRCHLNSNSSRTSRILRSDARAHAWLGLAGRNMAALYYATAVTWDMALAFEDQRLGPVSAEDPSGVDTFIVNHRLHVALENHEAGTGMVYATCR